jgi:hypothetical protein
VEIEQSELQGIDRKALAARPERLSLIDPARFGSVADFGECSGEAMGDRVGDAEAFALVLILHGLA